MHCPALRELLGQKGRDAEMHCYNFGSGTDRGHATEARGWSYVSSPTKGMERSEKGLPREVDTQANNCLSQVTASMESSVSSVRDTGSV